MQNACVRLIFQPFAQYLRIVQKCACRAI
jgi:hypothetical protein